MDQVIVPQADLDMLEETRQELHDLAKEKGWDLHLITLITSRMWKVTHRKYPPAES